jgi:phage antirepressor YoqD-like protein
MNIIKFPVIAGVEIIIDDQNRFNLNALHKASGLGNTKRPSIWLANQLTIELIQQLESQSQNSGLAQKPINSIKGGSRSGTFAHELLAISYAMWVSPKFHLQVIQVFFDYKNGNLKPAHPVQMSRLDILQLAMQAEEENIKLLAKIEEIQPKAVVLDRIACSDGSMCITDTAKYLKLQPKVLFTWLEDNRWIYKRNGNKDRSAFQNKINQGLLEHKVTQIPLPYSRIKTTSQVRVTNKGLAKLAYAINKEAA